MNEYMKIVGSFLARVFFEVNWSFAVLSKFPYYNNITGNFNVVYCDLLLLNLLIVFLYLGMNEGVQTVYFNKNC